MRGVLRFADCLIMHLNVEIVIPLQFNRLPLKEGDVLRLGEGEVLVFGEFIPRLDEHVIHVADVIRLQDFLHEFADIHHLRELNQAVQ